MWASGSAPHRHATYKVVCQIFALVIQPIIQDHYIDTFASDTYIPCQDNRYQVPPTRTTLTAYPASRLRWHWCRCLDFLCWSRYVRFRLEQGCIPCFQPDVTKCHCWGNQGSLILSVFCASTNCLSAGMGPRFVRRFKACFSISFTFCQCCEVASRFCSERCLSLWKLAKTGSSLLRLWGELTMNQESNSPTLPSYLTWSCWAMCFADSTPTCVLGIFNV